MKRLINYIFTAVFVLFSIGVFAQKKILNLNKPAREQWFTDLGFGMFIHWSLDVQLGMVISHSMVGASDDYINRYINELPKTFNPTMFHAADWAKAAKMAGMKYVVFTAKHHNGFCMYNTKTTNFSISNTPFGKDITKMVVDAFRNEGIAIGIYFSPEDFYYLHKQGFAPSRNSNEVLFANNPKLAGYAQQQMKELMTNYGKIDVVFLDGLEQYAMTELAKTCWKINPDVVVTRGAIKTPEQETPDKPMPSPWEACYTLGDQWQYRPTNEYYKTAWQLIEKLVEVKAKGGNLLLNFGPDAKGNFPQEQWNVLNEFSLWMFINKELFAQTVPYKVIREGNIWFLKSKKSSSVYAVLFEKNWKLGDRKEFEIKSIKPTANTRISVLGQSSKELEYSPQADVASKVSALGEGITISVVRAQRIYNDRKWPNPIVVKLENVVVE